MICDHPWVVVVIVTHWAGKWEQFHCCVCGTGLGSRKMAGYAPAVTRGKWREQLGKLKGRSRTKSGKWRKKRSDSGKRR